MNAETGAIQGYQRSLDLLAALNSLLIYIKLRHVHKEAALDPAEVSGAGATIDAFLGDLENLVPIVEQGRRPAVGADALQRRLAEAYVDAKRRQRGQWKTLNQCEISEMRTLLLAQSEFESGRLIAYLTDLRSMVEEEMQPDVKYVIGRI